MLNHGSLHFEIAQRHALVELLVLDMKFDVVVAGFGRSQLSDIDSGDFANSARCLHDRFSGFLGPHGQRDFSLVQPENRPTDP